MKCKRCQSEKDISQFQKSELRPNKGSQWCRDCVREYKRQWKEKRRRVAGVPVKEVKYLTMRVGPDSFKCRKCDKAKTASEFAPSNLRPRGRGWCNQCLREHVRVGGVGRKIWEAAQAKYKDSGKLMIANRRWRKSDEGRMVLRDISLRRRALKSKSATVRPKVMREHYKSLLVAQRGACAICRQALEKFHVDHIQPLARGGMHVPENTQLLCPPCNRSKSDKDPVKFMQERGYLL